MFTSEQLVQRWEGQRAIKNLMGKYANCVILNREQEIFGRFWAGAREDLCLGFNDGYYQGPGAVAGYYAACRDRNALVASLLQKRFPEVLGGLSPEEIYGVGPFKVKPMACPIIEVAADGETAKGIWYSRGTYNDITPQGPVAFWDYAVFACDFVREEGQWKILHMLRLSDIVVPGGKSWGKHYAPYPDLPEFAGARGFEPPEPTVKKTLREPYYPGRPFAPLPEPPVPYRTFQETFSYGYEGEDAR